MLLPTAPKSSELVAAQWPLSTNHLAPPAEVRASTATRWARKCQHWADGGSRLRFLSSRFDLTMTVAARVANVRDAQPGSDEWWRKACEGAGWKSLYLPGGSSKADHLPLIRSPLSELRTIPSNQPGISFRLHLPISNNVSGPPGPGACRRRATRPADHCEPGRCAFHNEFFSLDSETLSLAEGTNTGVFVAN